MADVVLTDADSGETAQLRVGDHLVIRLEESPTTGYRWKVDQVDDRVLHFRQARFIPAGSGLGAAGTREFEFDILGEGPGTVRLKLWRSWEGEGSVTRRFEASVRASASS